MNEFNNLFVFLNLRLQNKRIGERKDSIIPSFPDMT